MSHDPYVEDATPTERIDQDKPCPRCGTATSVDLVPIPVAGDVPPYPTVDGIRHCTECDWTDPPLADEGIA